MLVVDDMPLVLAVTAAQVMSLGYTAEATLDPRVALKWLRERPADFCALLTDFHMPAFTGLELARQVRETLCELPVVFYTSSLDLEPAEVRALGKATHLQKPARRAELAGALESVLRAQVKVKG